MGNFDRLTYRSEPIPDLIRDAAEEAASVCGFDQWEEHLLDSEVIDIRWISPDSAIKSYPEYIIPTGSIGPEELLRVDWRTWAIPKEFTGQYVESVVIRSESMIVDLPTLISREVFTYGLGPEYNWIDWGEFDDSSSEISDTALNTLRELIAGDWRQKIIEYAESDKDYLEEIDPALRDAVSKILNAQKRKKKK